MPPAPTLTHISPLVSNLPPPKPLSSPPFYGINSLSQRREMVKVTEQSQLPEPKCPNCGRKILPAWYVDNRWWCPNCKVLVARCLQCEETSLVVPGLRTDNPRVRHCPVCHGETTYVAGTLRYPPLKPNVLSYPEDSKRKIVTPQGGARMETVCHGRLAVILLFVALFFAATVWFGHDMTAAMTGRP